MKGLNPGKDTPCTFERSLWLRLREQTGRQEAGRSVKSLPVVRARRELEEKNRKKWEGEGYKQP